MLTYLIIFIAVFIVSYSVVHRWKSQRLYKLAESLPGHDGLSLIESIRLVLTTPRKDYIAKIISYAKEDSPMTKIWLLNKLLIITKDADFVHKVFNTSQTYDKPDVFYQAFLLEKGLILLAGSEHKRHRKVLNKAFTSKMLQRLPDIFDEKSKKIIEMMEVHEDCGEFELMDYIGAFSLETFGRSNLNYEIEYFQSEIYQAYERYSSLMIDALPYLMLGLNINMLKGMKIGQKIEKVFSQFGNFIDKSVSANQLNNNFIENSAIHILLDPKNGFDEKDVRDELILMLLGAFETSTRLISTVLMLLGMNKDIQHKLLTEIDKIYSTEVNTKFAVDFLQKFKYLDMVIKETMRLFTVVPLVARTTSAEVEINGFLVPKDTTILISLYAMHRDEKYWGSDAASFRPERFENGPTNVHAFAPFTGGSRICIGYRYAMMAMKVFLVNFLRTYRVHCAAKFEELETEMTLTLNLVNGYKVSISKR